MESCKVKKMLKLFNRFRILYKFHHKFRPFNFWVFDRTGWWQGPSCSKVLIDRQGNNENQKVIVQQKSLAIPEKRSCTNHVLWSDRKKWCHSDAWKLCRSSFLLQEISTPVSELCIFSALLQWCVDVSWHFVLYRTKGHSWEFSNGKKTRQNGRLKNPQLVVISWKPLVQNSIFWKKNLRVGA